MSENPNRKLIRVKQTDFQYAFYYDDGSIESTFLCSNGTPVINTRRRIPNKFIDDGSIQDPETDEPLYRVTKEDGTILFYQGKSIVGKLSPKKERDLNKEAEIVANRLSIALNKESKE